MNLAIGILIFVLGIIALFAWFAELVPFLKGTLVLSLLFWGAAGIVVGLAKTRAKGQRTKARNDKPSEAEAKS